MNSGGGLLTTGATRRWLRVILWVGVALFVLSTGHRLRLARPDADRIRFAHTFTTESERAILDDVIAEFRRIHPNIRVEQSIANSEVYNSVGWRLQFQGRNPPDIYFHWQGYKVGVCIERGWAMDLTPHLTSGFVDQFVPAALGPEMEGTYFLPHSVDVCNLVWYNRDLFHRENLKEPETFEEWVELCGTLRERGILPLAQGNRDLWPMGNFAAELFGQAMGDSTFAGLFDPGVSLHGEALPGFERLEELRSKGAFDLPGVLEPGAVGGLGDIDAKVLFLGGRSAMHVLGAWFMADIQDAIEKGELPFEVGLFPVPAGQGEVDAMAGVTTGYLVHPDTANPEAAVDFLELLLSPKYQAQFGKLGALSGRKDAAEFTEHPLARAMLDVLAEAEVVVPPPDTGFRPDQANVFYGIVGKVLTGQRTPTEAVDQWNQDKATLARKGL